MFVFCKTMSFQDHFSKQSEIYARARPTYPVELYEYLTSLAPSRQSCWDCGTGNGQAALPLSKLFQRVIATDPSQQQISNAIKADNIEYRVATAEESGLPDKSVDLITVATAAHWFDHSLFYPEAERVAKPNGILALWTYSESIIEPEIDELMEWFAYTLLHDYWPDGRWYVRNKYETLPFPFKAIDTPKFYSRYQNTLAQWLDYIRSWSAYNKYMAKHGTDPIEILLPKITPLWTPNELKKVVRPLYLKCARLNSTG